MPKTIKFKSKPENWKKEYSGLKRNTTRIFNEGFDIRKEVLDDCIAGKWNLIDIEIENTKTTEIFTRHVTDVTPFENIYIISW